MTALAELDAVEAPVWIRTGACSAKRRVENLLASQPPVRSLNAVTWMALGSRYEAMPKTSGVNARYLPPTAVPAPAIATGGDDPDNDVCGKPHNTRVTLELNLRPALRHRRSAFSLPTRFDAKGILVGLELEKRAGEDRRLLAMDPAPETVRGQLPPPGLVIRRAA